MAPVEVNSSYPTDMEILAGEMDPVEVNSYPPGMEIFCDHSARVETVNLYSVGL